VAPSLQYEDALSVQWVPSSLPGHPGSQPLVEQSIARVAVQFASATSLRDAQLRIAVSGPVELRSRADVRLGHVEGFARSRSTVVFDVEAGGTGSIEATLSGYASDGTFLRYSSLLSLATGGGRVAFSVDGLLAAQVNALDLRRASLGTARYLRLLATLLGSGARQTFSEGAAPRTVPTWTKVAGTIDYTASNGTHHPARSITVQIWDANRTSPTGSLVTSTTTNLNGQYSATVTTLRSDGKARDVYVQALAANSGFLIVPASGGTLAQHIDSTPNATTGAAQTVNLLANNIASNNTAFDVADMLVTGDQYVLRIHGNVPFKRVTVSYPNAGGTSFTPGTNSAKILQGDTFDWDVVLHEFGHYVAFNLGIDTSLGGLHDWADNLGQIYGKNAGDRLAWSEGFATWFSLTAELVENVAALKIPNAGDDFFDDTDDANFHVPMTVNTPYPSLGEDNELSVARSLWHMRTDSDLAMSDLLIIDTLVAKHVTTLSNAIAALLPAGGAAPFGNVDTGGDQYPANAELKINTFGCLETSQVVSPQVTAPAAGAAVGATPPTFTWQANGAGPSNRLNRFYVQFWSPTWGKLLFQSPQITSAATANSDTYTPAQADWNTLMGTTDENGNYPTAMNVIVVGSGANAPATGPYGSCALHLLVDSPVLGVTPADTTDKVIAPIPQLCNSGYFDPLIDQFVLDASGLQPGTTYSLELFDPRNGYGPVTTLSPNLVTSDAQGDVSSTTITIPDMPAESSWPLILTPLSGRPGTTNMAIQWDSCGETLATTGPTPLYWGGAGVVPNTLVTISWDGTQVDQVTSQADGEYWYVNGSPPTVTCTGADTLTIDATTYNGPSQISGPFQCTAAAPERGVVSRR
jgi:hypothetical protein